VIRSDCQYLLLTGSSAKGRTKKYYYYHCILPCKARFHTAETHDLFSKELKKFIPRPGIVEVYKEVIGRLYKDQTKGERPDLRSIKQELEQVNVRLAKARNLLVEDQTDTVSGILSFWAVLRLLYTWQSEKFLPGQVQE